MLHELLLSLSGHPSPLLKERSSLSESLQSTTSPAELALLGSLAEGLGKKHSSIRDSANDITASHPSTVCRAVASSITFIHLAAFQQRILEVENEILKEDASLVGAYNVVPLSAIVGSFEGWGRKLEWLWALVQFIQVPAPSSTVEPQDERRACTSAMLIERLRDSLHTGYPEIAEMSLSLVRAAETAWLKQLSAWVLYGRHPREDDFFITSQDSNGYNSGLPVAFGVTSSLLPPFVSKPAANSVLFIGKSLNHIRDRQMSDTRSIPSTSAPELALLPAHLSHLSGLQSPISVASFSAAINAIRLSLSQNALQKLLPISKVLELLYILKDFFLLERGEFAIALITSADDRLDVRNGRAKLQRKNAPTLEEILASMTIKEGEVHAVLARAWTALTSFRGELDVEDVDEEIDRARDLISLSIKSIDTSSAQHRDHSKEKAPIFDDLLLPSSTALSIKVPSPLDLFLTVHDTQKYSQIHAYLIAIRRAHLRLSRLFLLSKLRRDYPCPRAPTQLPHKERMNILDRMRQLSNQRTHALRPAWATIGSATFFFAELSEYFQSEVIERSWSTFHSWLIPSISDRPNSSNNNESVNFPSQRPGSSNSSTNRPDSSRPTSSRANIVTSATSSPHDPETLALAHRRYLSTLTHSLLLDNPTFTRPLRRLMTSIDHITALMQRLNAVQTNLDTLSDTSATKDASSFANTTNNNHIHPSEESRLLSDIRASLPHISTGVTGLIEILRNIDESRNTKASGKTFETSLGVEEEEEDEQAAAVGGISMAGDGAAGGLHYIPWSSRSLDRLLLKFDYKNVDDFLKRDIG